MPSSLLEGWLRKVYLLAAIVLFVSVIAAAQSKPSAEERTSRYLESIRHQPLLMLAFLREMPKGGDLHNHLDGAIYAESWIDFAADNNLCVDRTTSILIAPPAMPPVSTSPASLR